MNRKDYLSVSLLIILLFIIFGRVLFSNQIFAQRDIAIFVFPLKYFVVEQLKTGIIPLWNPYSGCGTPFIAEIQSHLFYPLSLMFYLFPFRLAFNLFILIHFFLAGLFMYGMMREFQYNRGSAIFSAITFGFSGYLTSLVDLLNNLASLTWMPLAFLFSRRFIIDEKARLKNALWLGASLGIQFLGGEPQYVLMTFLINLMWISYELIFKNLTSEGKSRISNLLKSWKLLRYGGISGLVFFGLIAFQLLPFLEYVQYSTRPQGFSYEAATHWSLPPWQLLQLFLPRFFEFYYGYFWGWVQTWVADLYLGVTPLLLIYYGLRFSLRRKREVTFFAIWLTIFVLLSLGRYFPAYPFFYQYLGFDKIRYPIKFFAPVVFFYPFLLERGSGFSSPNILLKMRVEKSDLSCQLLFF